MYKFYTDKLAGAAIKLKTCTMQVPADGIVETANASDAAELQNVLGFVPAIQRSGEAITEGTTVNRVLPEA